MRVLIVAGGTGGHVYPALSVARSLRARPDAPELAWLGGRRGIEERLVPAAGIVLRLLVLRSLRTVQADVHALLDPVRLVASVPQAIGVLARWRPDAILTTGGFVSVPAVLAAAVLRVPVVLWEGNAVPGRATRATARLAAVRAVSHAETGEWLGGPWYLTGTPIRELPTIDRDLARGRLGIPAGKPCLLVFGGSQEVRRFNDAIRQALPEAARRAAIVHVTGPRAIAEFEALGEALPADARAAYRPYAFLGEGHDGPGMADALVAADLVIGRAGASTLAEVAAAGRPMIVVPYPHAAAHQAANARTAVEAGAARLIADEAFDGAALLEAAALLADEPGLGAMRAAARRLARPRAADAVATLVAAVARREPLPDRAAVDRIAGAAA